MNGCSVAHHKFWFFGRCTVDVPDGPKKGWLIWRSEDHEPTEEGVVRHTFAIAPEKFWPQAARLDI